MNDNKQTRTALITGGGVGIGAAIARALADDGLKVAITYRTHAPTQEFLDGLREASGHEPLALAVDATDEAAVNQMVETVAGKLGRIDVLVNNIGGLIKRARLTELTLDLWQEVQACNVVSTFLVTRAVRPHMPEGGRIINLSSLAAESGGHPGALAYATSKGAIVSFTRALAQELSPEGITVNAVLPGFIEATPFHDTFTTAESKAKTITGIPVGRAGVPEDVASAVAWLATPGAAFVSGAMIDVNGAQYFA